MKGIFLALFFLLFMVNFLFAQDRTADSMRTVFRKEIKDNKSDTSVAIAYLSLAQLTENIYPDSAIQIYLQGVEIIQTVLKQVPPPSEAIARQFNSILADAYNNIAAIYISKVNIPTALDYNYKSLKIKEDIGNKKGIAESSNNIAMIQHYYLQDFQPALGNYLKALHLFEESGDKRGEAIVLHNVAGIYKTQGDTTRALDNYFRSLKIREETNDQQGISDALNNIAVIYREKGDLNHAFEYGNKSLKIRNEIADRQGIAYAHWNLGECWLLQGNLKNAKEFGERSLQAGKALSNPDIVQISAFLLQKILKKQELWKEALAMEELYFSSRDSVLNRDSRRAAIKQQVRYEYEKKSIADSIRYIGEQREKDLKIQQQKATVRYLIAGFMLLIVAAWISLYSYNQKKKAVFLQQVSETKMKALRAQMNPHFIYNSLNSVYRYMQGNDFKSAGDYLISFSKLIRTVLENSLHKEVSLAEELKALELFLSLEAARLNNKFVYEITVADDIDKENTLIPPLLLEPYIENSIWHGFRNKEGLGKIKLSISKNGDMMKCIIEDNGVGRQRVADLQTMPDTGKSESVGMKLTEERISTMNQGNSSKAQVTITDLFDDLRQPAGVKVEISLPLLLND